MDGPEHNHWTRDPEKLDRYVLNRLDPSERSAFQRHLTECPECQEAVRRERELAAGVQAYGRKRLKNRLEEALRRHGTAHVPWVRIVSAAAVVMLVVGIGLFNRWFFVAGERSDVDHAKGGQGQLIPTEEKETAATATAPKDAERLDGAVAQKSKEDPAVLDERKGYSLGVPKSQKQLLTPRKDSRDLHDALTQGGAGVVSQTPVAQKESPVEMKVQADFSSTQETWIEGVILSDRSGRGDLRMTGEPDVKVMSKSMPARAAESREPGQTLELEQQPSTLLPEAQKRRQVIKSGIPTRMAQTRAGLKMTLYLDSLVQESDLLNAHIHHVRPDSLVLEIASQRIGYQIPAGLYLEQSKKSLHK